jgi:hypothetical protein
MAQYFEQSKITYQQLVMEQIKIIQNIASKELRDSTKTVKNLVGEQTIESEDTRHSFLQAINALGSLLSPYFGKSKIEDEYELFCDLLDMDLSEAIEDEDFIKKLIKFFDDKDIKDKISKDETLRYRANLYFLNFKIQQAWILFRSLVKLFKENDFLGNESFGESSQVDDSLEAIDDSEDE